MALTPFSIRHRIASLWFGFTLPFAAGKLIVGKPKLLLWSALPIVLTLALSIWGVAWVKAKLVAMSATWLAAQGYAPDSFAVQAAMVLLQIVLFVVAAVSFSFLAGVVASPFNDFLAETAEPYAKPGLPALRPEQTSVAWKIRAVWIDIVKTAVVTTVQIGLVFIGVLAFWLPGLNMIPFAIALWLMTFQFVSYPQTRRGEGFGVSVRFLMRHFFASLGFGSAVGILFAIPILSAFAFPLAVVGGTLLYARAAASDPHRLY